MWDRIVTVKDYPKWVKFCKSVTVAKVEKGGGYRDVTTLLWIPIVINHVITKLTPKKDIWYFLTLPGGGKMWCKFSFSLEDSISQVYAEIEFDLGSRIANFAFGHILEKRWEDMIRSSFPEIEYMKRIY